MRMNARERVLAAIRREPVDRVPTDIWAMDEVWTALERAFGSRESAREKLHIDGMAYLAPPYVGPTLPSAPEGETVNLWGMRHRRVQCATGVYWEQFHHPLAHVRTLRDLEEYSWPSPEWFDYAALAGLARNAREKQAVLCGYKIFPFGTPEEVRTEVRASIDALASDGTDYILAPCHNLQAVSPLANIVAMYEEAWAYGAR